MNQNWTSFSLALELPRNILEACVLFVWTLRIYFPPSSTKYKQKSQLLIFRTLLAIEVFHNTFSPYSAVFENSFGKLLWFFDEKSAFETICLISFVAYLLYLHAVFPVQTVYSFINQRNDEKLVWLPTFLQWIIKLPVFLRHLESSM